MPRERDRSTTLLPTMLTAAGGDDERAVDECDKVAATQRGTCAVTRVALPPACITASEQRGPTGLALADGVSSMHHCALQWGKEPKRIRDMAVQGEPLTPPRLSVSTRGLLLIPKSEAASHKSTKSWFADAGRRSVDRVTDARPVQLRASSCGSSVAANAWRSPVAVPWVWSRRVRTLQLHIRHNMQHGCHVFVRLEESRFVRRGTGKEGGDPAEEVRNGDETAKMN